MEHRGLKLWKNWLAVLVLAALLAGCAGPARPEAVRPAASSQPAAETLTPDVTYQLRTVSKDGRLAFEGVGGEIDGQINPDLNAKPGDVVEIVLINGDGLQSHTLTVDGFKAVSDTVTQKGDQARLLFKAESPGVFAYGCAQSNHRSAGLRGRLIVDGNALAQTGAVAGAVDAADPAGMDMGNAAQSAAVSYRLVTTMQDGKMVFTGKGGEIDGLVNPDLNANPGDSVELILENGDNINHNLEVAELNLTSDEVVQAGQETRLTFTAEKEGTYAYYCAIPGHRQAGMEGKLIIGKAAPAESASMDSISLAPDALPAPIERDAPERVRVDLETVEVTGRLANGVSYTFWTFNGTVPGPFIRVRVGDTVEVHLKNSLSSHMVHSVDFHAVTGPGGGATVTQAGPGEEKSFTFQALNPGLYVYHCATPMVAHHITNGMYGLILVEPEGGLEPVDREFYVMQGEIYTTEPFNQQGAASFSVDKLLAEEPEYFVFNGAAGALTEESPLKANVGETVRIFFGVGGPNFTSSFHVIGEIFDRVYDQASLTANPLTDVQTTLVPPGGATMVEFKLDVPGRYILVDHALSRMERGLAGYLLAEGPEAPEIFHSDEAPSTAGH